jgi:RNA polymerase sigma factor (sigma-70 family)
MISAETPNGSVEDLLRQLAPQVLGMLVRRHDQFDACEDAVQEALLAATTQWPVQGVPDRPRSWLITVASRSLIDHWRADSARRRREAAAALDPTNETAGDPDDTLVVLFLCCHPELSAPSQLALTLRAAGGLSTAQVAAAFLVPETTMAQRISRAKQRIRETGGRFELPASGERAARLAVVLHVLYLMFNEGYTATSGPNLHRPDVTAEAIRLTRLLHRLLPGDGEVAGLLALMLLIDARRAARTDLDGSLVPLAAQDRHRWDAAAIAEGRALLHRTLGAGPVGPYQIQAAIAAVHDEAAADADTDWPQILALYDVLDRVAPGPVVTLSRAVAVAMVHGPTAGLAALGTLADDDRLAQTHRLEAVRAHLLERAGDLTGARQSYLRAAQMTASLPEQHYLTRCATMLDRERFKVQNCGVAVDVSTEIVIDRPCAEVAAYTADPSHAPDWYVNIDSVEWLTEPPVQIGSRLAFVARFLGRRLAYTYEIVELVPGERLVMRTAEGPFPMETTYTWQPAGEGRTQMTLRNRGEPTGFSTLGAPFMVRAMRRANRKDLATLKSRLESGG